MLFKNMKLNTEYILSTGRHRAIIRKTNSGIEYLELQSPIPTENTFKPLTDEKLVSRFGCQKSHTSNYQKYEVENMMIAVDSLKNNKDFLDLLGYLNTNITKQIKGVLGGIK